MSENLNNNNASGVESATDIAQFIALLNPIIPTRAYTSFLSANAGFAGSLSDLIQKIDNGTATRNDFIDVAKDLAGIGTGFATFTNMLGITAIPLPVLIGIGIGFAVLDYLDSNNYDPDEIMNDINLIKDGILNWLKEVDLADDILPDFSNNEGHNENFSSPLVLDLNGNGTTSTFIAQSETYFDMDGDGFRERTSWTESTDGLLTLDLNNDGKVTNGGELFGNNTKLTNGTTAKDGFEALSQYDLNKDNVIDAKDSIYSHLKVWSDSNSDGISTEDELKTLQELNITSINLNSKETSTSEAYNQISDTSTFTQDGQTKILLTCKHFSIQKSLHVRNEIQHKGAESNGKDKVA